jgi:hypothetical protein
MRIYVKYVQRLKKRKEKTSKQLARETGLGKRLLENRVKPITMMLLSPAMHLFG